MRKAFLAPTLLIFAATLPYICLQIQHVAAAPALPLLALLVASYLIGILRVKTARQARTIQAQMLQEVALRESAQKAERKKNEFLTNISHEIRTLMNGIIGFTDLALKNELSSELREYLGTVRTSADWLMRIINDILDFSRIEAGRLQVEKSDFIFAECIRTAVTMVQPQATEKNLMLGCKIDAEIPRTVFGDRDRIRQVVVNLLDNAVKFTVSGSVILTASLASPPEEDLMVRISVADTGPGIPPQRQKNIFEPLGESVANKAFGTTGLGLAICSKLAALMGGEIEVQSQLGAGSTFHFTVRLERARGVPSKPASIRALPPRNPRLSILLVEDDWVSRRLATKLLESAGHQVTPAATGRQAVDLFAGEIFDLILMDLQLPEMNGLEATEMIRQAEPEDCHVPIYAMTASVGPHDHENCLAAGMDGYLPKPIEIEHVLEIVTNVASLR